MPTANEVIETSYVQEVIRRGIIQIDNNRIIYNLNQRRSYEWSDPEEWVRAHTLSWLIAIKAYPANRIRTEVPVPRRTPSDFADIVVYEDDRCRDPYLVVENKSDGQSRRDRNQGIEQTFGNANSLRAPLALYDEYSISILFDVANFPSAERELNRLGDRQLLPDQYGQITEYTYIAGTENDIEPVATHILESTIRRAHAKIWSGGRRDPLTAFDQWSMLLFAKVFDERTTPTNEPRRFQVGTNETVASVANRIHELFGQACRDDPTIFPQNTRLTLPDNKITEVIRVLQDVCLTRTDVDSVGRAFEEFFGSIFRGELGQYFTMRQLARFTVGLLNINHEDFVLDPAAGSGGFLLEALLQVWHRIDNDFSGQTSDSINRLKSDFALQRVFGIEIHEVLARICKINLLLHHDGHTNIEGDRSCLDERFTISRFNPPRERFSCIIGNPPFGDEVEEGDEDHLGTNRLENFTIAQGRRKVHSEQVILERSIEFLESGGRLGLVLPDGLLNNQGVQSNCPQTRKFLAKNGKIIAVVSLADHAFRKAGAQNKTSILFYEKFNRQEKATFDRIYNDTIQDDITEEEAISVVYREGGLDFNIFFAEANHVGYLPTGRPTDRNDLYQANQFGFLSEDQSHSILGEWRNFINDTFNYQGQFSPDCMSMLFSEAWIDHPSNRLDPKYFLFQREILHSFPDGWVRAPISEIMRRREDMLSIENPDREYQVITISQTGEIRSREAGKGNNPPRWVGTYFEESPGTWYIARSNDLVFSSIDLWKGCIAIVPEDFDGALVTKEFPIYEITDDRIDRNFLQCLLRSRYYQRAFRAITTGHSNRRRTQIGDFENLVICFPPDPVDQLDIIDEIQNARNGLQEASRTLRDNLQNFDYLIDARETNNDVYEIEDTEADG